MHYAPPRLPEALLPIKDAHQAVQQARREEWPLSGVRLENADFANQDLSRLALSQATVTGCRFTGCDLTKLDCTDVVFAGCDLSNAVATDAFFGRCVFESCKAVGLRAQNALWRQTAVRDSVFEYVNFDGAALECVRWARTGLGHAFLTNCKLKQAVFAETDLIGVNFTHTALKGVDLTHSQLAAVTVSGDMVELAGAVVSPQQAVELARLLGLVVKG